MTDLSASQNRNDALPMGGAFVGESAYGVTEASVSDYVALLKPRVMSLVVFTAVAGMAVAPGGIHPVLAVIAVVCIAVGAGASAAINMWYDRDIDAVMRRTRSRPIPAGRMAPDAALGFGIVLAVGSVTMMALAVNWAAAGLLALTIAFYVFVYTVWLKRRTPQNIVIGGAAGAFPPMIGWTVVTGTVDPVSWSLFALIFFWTPPHFWALALFRRGDYADAGVPMMPVTAGVRATKRQMLAYTVLMLPLAILPALLGVAGWLYGGVAVVSSVMFIAHGWRVLRAPDDSESKALIGPARRMFAFSIAYLFILFAVLMVDGGLGLTEMPAAFRIGQ